MIEEILETVRNEGLAVAQLSLDYGALREFHRGLGCVSARDGGRPLWPVRPSFAPQALATFSTRRGAAPFHTDSSYYTDCEDLVSLTCVRPANRGGDSLIVTREEAERVLLLHPDGRRAMKLLSESAFKFRAPPTFGSVCTPDWVPVLSPEVLRFRPDVIEAIDDEHLAAANLFTTVLEAHAIPIRIQLQRGQCLVLANHRVLHTRDEFEDNERFLIRTRVWTPDCLAPRNN